MSRGRTGPAGPTIDHDHAGAGAGGNNLNPTQVWLGKRSSTPSDSEIPSGSVAFYAKDDDNVYKKPDGGSESQVGGAFSSELTGDYGDPVTVGANLDIGTNTLKNDTTDVLTFNFAGDPFLHNRDGDKAVQLGQSTASFYSGGPSLNDGGGVTVRGELGQFELPRQSTETSAFSATIQDSIYPIDTTGGSFTGTIASGASGDGGFVIFQDVGGAARSNPFTIATGSGQGNINGQSTVTLDRDFGAALVWNDGSNWFTRSNDIDTILDRGTVTATGGSSPALDATITNVGISETEPHNLVVYVESGVAADYAYNYDWGFQHDNTNGEQDINLTVNWDTDPGTGNDVTLRWELVSP